MKTQSSFKDIERSLYILGFTSLPDSGQLRKQFSVLVKQNHPDVSSTPLAAEKTRTIVDAFRKVSGFLESGEKQKSEFEEQLHRKASGKMQSQRRSNDSRVSQKGNSHSRKKKSPETGFQCLLIEAGKSGYAIPVSLILEVMDCMHDDIRQSLLGYHIRVNSISIPLKNISGKAVFRQKGGLVLLCKSENEPIALYVSPDLRISFVKSFEFHDCIQGTGQLASETWLQVDGRIYCIPFYLYQQSMRQARIAV